MNQKIFYRFSKHFPSFFLLDGVHKEVIEQQKTDFIYVTLRNNRVSLIAYATK